MDFEQQESFKVFFSTVAFLPKSFLVDQNIFIKYCMINVQKRLKCFSKWNINEIFMSWNCFVYALLYYFAPAHLMVYAMS